MKTLLRFFLFCMAFGFGGFSMYSQEQTIGSLKEILEKSQNDSVKCLALGKLTDLVPSSEKAKFNDQLKVISLKHFEDKSTRTSFFKNQYAISLRITAELLADKGAMVNALELFNQSLKIMREINNKRGMAAALYGISEIYIVQGDITRSHPYSIEALSLMEEINDKKGIVDCSEQIGNYIEFHDQEFEKALDCYHKGLNIAFEIDYKKGAAYLEGNIARVLLKQKNYQEALNYNLKSLALKEEIGDKKGVGYSLHKIGQIYFEQGNLLLAYEYAQRSYKVAKEIGFPDNIKRAADLLSSIYKSQGDHKNALSMYQEYITMRDSLNNMELQKVSIQKQMQFDFEHKQLKERAEQEKKDAINREQEAKQKIIIWAILFFLLLALFFSLFMFRSLKTTAKQKKVIEEKHKEITDSINYAERIQRALLASKQLLDENLRDYFILFSPKDVVSGDFYWASKLSNGNFVLVTADSTGHGVPGSIMSILNMASLKEAVIQGIQRPDLILNETRRLVIESLANDGSPEGGKDGMDASAIAFDFKKKILYCACAFNPVWIIRGAELIEIVADRIPVGKHENDQIPFTLHTLELKKGDLVYTFTDGYADQFGGPKLKKFMYKRMKDLLMANSQTPLEQQKEILEQEFNAWKGDLEQVDDVCVIGVRV